MNMALHRSPSVDEAAGACARMMLSSLEAALERTQHATLAVSGGSAPRLLFPKLLQRPFPWQRVHLFWVDERPVPPDHEDSNYRAAEEYLIRPAGIPAENIHRIESEYTPHEAAERYVEEIRRFFLLKSGELPNFDVIQCGMGSDVHTASLFPGEPLIHDRIGIAAAVHVGKLRQSRITLLPGVLLKAHELIFLATGEDKAQGLRAVFEGESDALRYPAQAIAREAVSVHWFADEGATLMLP
ncbi:MAG: 6-phosphogluconolactonase [Bryobacteraceae bacterium]